MKNIFIFIMVLSLAPLASAEAACPLPIETPLSAVALFKAGFLERLENENRLKEICPAQDNDCLNKALSPQTDKIPVYDRPSGKMIASLDVTYTPGTGMTAALVQDGKAYPYTPSVYDNDWGYGPWFHATLLDQAGAWKNIALPFVQSGWIDLPEAEILQFNDAGRAYSLNGRNVVILKSNREGITVRDQQPADIWCDAGDPPPLAAFKEQLIPIGQIYDDQCNLLLSPAHTRGC